ncbi:CIC11C00000004414 [Sungouiella intermedia]|uniref:Phosphatidylinositol 3-kinase VPS34 n=1 Tax=Sungouiella intermedia TaxID=45354 RepID=A0A1L0D2R1_9ASCO|nr:CIC11C00000004414 [[Candida] intermedia]
MPTLESVANIGSFSSSSNTANFGLSKYLLIPISVKLCYFQTSSSSTHKVVTSSEKYKNTRVFQKLSDISTNSDLFVRIQVLDGNHNPIASEVQTPYKAFSSNKRVWNTYVRLPVDYHQVGYGAYIRFTVMEIVETTASVYGTGTLSLFNHENGTLRKGSYKVAIAPGLADEKDKVVYGDIKGTSVIEKHIIDYEDGEHPKISWLDNLSLPAVEKLRASMATSEDTEEVPYYLYMELPNFLLPIVYLDVNCWVPEVVPLSNYMDEVVANETGPLAAGMVIRSIEIPTTKSEDLQLAKIYDPSFHKLTLDSFNNTEANEPGQVGLQGVVAGQNVLEVDPIEQKFQTLATNVNNTSLLDKEVKPSPQMRDELWKILKKPSSAVLNDHDKRLLWKFRYYFSKNSLSDDGTSAAAPLQSTKQFLTKFLKCFNWENEYELDHAFKEILPYWSVDKIDIGDALELLSNSFSPYTLTASLRRRMISTTNSNAKDINTNEEKKMNKIYGYARKLRVFAVDRLRQANADELLLYLLQLVQALKYESVLAEGGDALKEAPLAKFLIEKSVQNGKLGNFFYWYVKVENEDQLSSSQTQSSTIIGPSQKGANHSIYQTVLNTYIEQLKEHCQLSRLPEYKYLKMQINFIKKLTSLVELIRTTFKKNEATSKKVQFLQDYLADNSNEMLKFPHPFPLPLDPSVMICGCYPLESSVFKSSLSPLKITFKTITNYQEQQQHSSQIFSSKKKKYGKYALMFKIGDDLRQDQLVIQIITLMDQLLKNENLNLKLTPYKILATSPVAGLIQFVPNETLDSVLSKSYADVSGVGQVQGGSASAPTGTVAGNGILSYLQLHSRKLQHEEPEAESVLGKKKNSVPTEQQQQAITSDLGVSPIVMDNYVKSCAGYCVITYILGVGDRHLDNLLLSPNGKFWHADFGYILGRDPKPFPPLMKLPIQVIDGMGGMDHENFNIFKSYCFITYTTLRRNSNLILNLFQLMLNANIPDIQIDQKRAVEKVEDKFALEMTEEEAILHFQNLISDSVNAFLPVVIDALHSLAQYWRA